MNHWQVIRSQPRLLAFGALLTFLSSVGQTFLIALFGGHIREALALGNAEYGLLYGLATLGSAVVLLRLGRVVDERDLRAVTAAVLLGAAGGCVLLAGAHNAAMLLLAFFVLRLCGQGMLMHTAQTTMGRYFRSGRGRAVGVSMLGLPLAEAVMPVVLVTTTAVLGWRGSWLAMATVLVAGVLPLALVLLRGHGERVARWQAQRRVEADAGAGQDGYRRSEVLHHPLFYALVPAVMAPPVVITALFFHQVPVAEEQGWSLEWLASSFLAFGAAHVIGLLAVGPLVDRMGARWLVPLALLPMIAALVLLAGARGDWVAPTYLFITGLSAGAVSTLMGALWAELYGTTHLGAIRAMVHAVMVTCTAAAPLLAGVLLDAGYAPATLALAFAAYTTATAALAALPLDRTPPRAA